MRTLFGNFICRFLCSEINLQCLRFVLPMSIFVYAFAKLLPAAKALESFFCRISKKIYSQARFFFFLNDSFVSLLGIMSYWLSGEFSVSFLMRFLLFFFFLWIIALLQTKPQVRVWNRWNLLEVQGLGLSPAAARLKRGSREMAWA